MCFDSNLLADRLLLIIRDAAEMEYIPPLSVICVGVWDIEPILEILNREQLKAEAVVALDGYGATFQTKKDLLYFVMAYGKDTLIY